MVLNQNQYISRIDITETNEPQKDVKDAFSEAGHNPLTGTTDAAAQSEQANDNELNEPQQFYSETKEAEPYPINALPNSLKGVIDYLEANVECDKSMIAPMIFSVLSVTFQHRYTVSFKIGTKYFNDISLSLAIILIALSSERKTSLEKDAFKPLKDYERNIINEITKKINEAKTKLSDWNEKDKALKGVITGIEKKLLIEFDDNKADTLQKQLNTAKERYTKFLEKEPQPIIPPTRNLFVKDVTIEALQAEYVNNTPYLALVNSEASMIFNGYSMNNDNAFATLAKYCDLVDGEPIDVKRIGRESFKLFNRAFTACLSIQPDIVKDFIRNGKATSQGFLPRCLLSHAKEKAGYRLMQTPYSKVQELRENFYNPYCYRISEVMQKPYKPKPDNALELDREPINLTEDAEQRLYEFYIDVETKQQKGKEYFYYKSFAGKAMQKVAQIATLFTLYEGKSFVEKSYIEQAITIVTWHLKEAMRIIDGKSDNSQPPLNTEKGLAENLRRYLFEKVFVNGNQTFNLRDLQNKLTRNSIGISINNITIKYGNNEITKIADKYRYLIDLYLVANEWLFPSEDSRNYTVNPKALNFKG
jgi:putative DNA primase/helicase